MAEMFLYNGVKLPDINTVWTDELKETFKYAVICHDTEYNTDYLYFSSVAFYADTELNFIYQQIGNSKRWDLSDGTWVLGCEGVETVGGHIFKADHALWTSHDILNKDDKVYLPASTPTPIYCLTFSSPEPFTISVYNKKKNWDGTLYYFTDGNTWSEWNGTTTLFSVEINGRYRIYIRGSGNSFITGESGSSSGRFVLTGYKIRCNGNIETLLNYETVENKMHPEMADYCYYYMFYNCTGLIEAPELPATTLTSYCYAHMFGSCTGLVNAPELPATTLTSYCYYYMFSRCKRLTKAPELPAMTLASYCYAGMFHSCYSLINTPELPATTLTSYCYAYMFSGCTGLTNAPELPAIILDNYCYFQMFYNCTSLIEVPELPATTLTSSCYSYMFYNCTSLIEAPELPATTLASYCYYYMFKGCKRLTKAPELPAMTLASYCYAGMFRECIELSNTPELHAIILADHCYYYMFRDCVSLINIPELPTATLKDYCYSGMFYNCTGIKLSSIRSNEYFNEYCINHVDDGSTVTSALDKMFENTGGKFTGTPKINTIYYLYKEPTNKLNPQSFMLGYLAGQKVYRLKKTYPKNVLTFASPKAFTIATKNARKNWDGALYYSTDAKIWNEWDGATTISSEIHHAQYRVYMRGIGNSVITGIETLDNRAWRLTGDDIQCIGNIETLLDYITYGSEHPVMAKGCYMHMFDGCTSLTKAPDLPATTLSMYCYSSMFYGCTSLTQAPKLPAITLDTLCYYQMFQNCTSLTKAPDLPATTVRNQCYSYMFCNCTSLTKAPELPATNLDMGSYEGMFLNCTSLTIPPNLPATALNATCYSDMFNGCISIKLSTTQIDGYQIPYMIPPTGNGKFDNMWIRLPIMFDRTGGTFTGAPSANTTYYLWDYNSYAQN